MDKVDVWIQLAGVEPQPKGVARNAAALAWRTLRNVPAGRIGSITVDPFESTQPGGGRNQRRFLPADVLVHVDYAVSDGHEIAALAAPWMRITELWPQLSVVLLRTGTAGNETAEIRGGLAVAVATHQHGARCSDARLQERGCRSLAEVGL